MKCETELFEGEKPIKHQKLIRPTPVKQYSSSPAQTNTGSVLYPGLLQWKMLWNWGFLFTKADVYMYLFAVVMINIWLFLKFT